MSDSGVWLAAVLALVVLAAPTAAAVQPDAGATGAVDGLVAGDADAAAVAADGGDGAGNGSENGSADAPGAMLSGVVGVQQAEVEGEVERRAFEVRLDRAGSNASRASVVADRTAAARERLATLRARKAALTDAYRADNVSRGEYRARLATLVADLGVTRGLVNRTATAAATVPDAALESKGVNASAIRGLRDAAAGVAGPGAADVARSVAGPGVGGSLGRPDRAGNGSGGPGERGERSPSDAGPGRDDRSASNATAAPDRGSARGDGERTPARDAPTAGNANAGRDGAGNRTTVGDAGGASSGGGSTRESASDGRAVDPRDRTRTPGR